MESADTAVFSPTFINTLASRRQGIAHDWYLAISSICSLVPDRTGALHRFSALSDRILAFLTDPAQDEHAARSIGADLAELHCIQPSVIDVTWRLWTSELADGATAADLAILQPRLITLICSLTSGFHEKARDMALREQDQIRRALVLSVEKMGQELEEHRLHLQQTLDKRTEQLHAKEEQYRLITEAAPLGIFQVDGSGLFVFANEAFCNMLGLRRQELIGRSFREVADPDDLADMTVQRPVLLGGGTVTADRRWLHKDGHRVVTVTRAVRMPPGSRDLIAAFIVDVTDQKRTEDALRASEALYRTLTEASNDLINLVSPRGEITYANTSSARQFGLAPGDLIGKRLTDFFPPHTTTRQLGNIRRADEGGGPLRVEAPIDFGDKILWLSTWLLPIKDGSDRAGSILVVSRDMTEQKRTEDALRASEERYRTLAESARDLILIIDRDHRISYINSFAAEYIGSKPDRLVGQPSSIFFPARSGKLLYSTISTVLQSGTAVRLEDTIKFKSGLAWLSCSLVALLDGSGNVANVFILARNISELKHTERALLRGKNQLERRVAERTARLASSQKRSRDLARQLITAQEEERRRVARELHDTTGQALISIKYEMSSMLKEMQAESRPARRRISKLLRSLDQSLQRIREISQDLRPPILDVAGIDLSLKEYCSELARKSSLSINYSGGDLPELDSEVAIGLFRIVQELLTNVLKHAQATEASVSLGRKQDVIMLVVEDNGKGMKSQSLPSGTGLLGVQERLDILGGKMTFHSPSGGGTKIAISVPWKELTQ